MNYRIVAAAIINRDDQVLLGYRPQGRYPYPDCWHIPGGGINLGEETCEQAVVREIREETGLEVKNLKQVWWNTGFQPNKNGEETYYTILVYACDYASGEISAHDDLEQVKWVSTVELEKYKFAEPTKELFKNLGYIRAG